MNILHWLTLLFIGLKLADIITWSWWLVLLPLWGPLAVLALMTLSAIILAIVKELMD